MGPASRIWGRWPRAAKGYTVVPAPESNPGSNDQSGSGAHATPEYIAVPMRVKPVTVTCDFSSTPSSRTTFSPTVQNGPILTWLNICALSETMAVSWNWHPSRVMSNDWMEPAITSPSTRWALLWLAFVPCSTSGKLWGDPTAEVPSPLACESGLASPCDLFRPIPTHFPFNDETKKGRLDCFTTNAGSSP
eukprot:scaffold5150_cov376-Prasinococcus_capsulatus_cf.AAC.10